MAPVLSRLPRWAYVVIALAVLAGGGLTAYLIWGRAPEDVSNPDAEFTVPQERPKPKKRKPENFVWPIFGYTPDRTKHFPARIDPPFKEVWRYRADSLLEFPPVLAHKTLFMVSNEARVVAVDADTGKRVWKRRIGSLSAASPAWWRGTLFLVTLDGRLTALRARDGKLMWKKDLPSRTESSPLVIGKRVFFGSEDGTVYAVKASNGKTIWTYQAPGAVKAALAYSDGRLFFGDYAGVATAIRARDGAKVWDTQSAGLALGRSGTFYSTPAVAFGRVYMGNTDGRVYSFTARSGEIAWTKSTGAYVYAGPAAANVGAGPTVFIGSYTGRFYALNARTGAERWSYQADGRISGAVSVIGRVVYFADLDTNDTSGLNVRTGERVFHLRGIGGYAPPISDGKRLYVTGHSRELAFEPKPKRKPKPKPKRRAKRR